MKELLLASTVLSGAFIFSSAANAAPCVANVNGTIDARNIGNAANRPGCTISTLPPVIGNTSIWNLGIVVDQYGVAAGGNRTLTVDNDLTTILKGSAGIAVGDGSAAAQAIFDARGKTINLTIENLDANAPKPIGDNIAKSGVGVSDGGLLMIGTLNLTMQNLQTVLMARDLVLGNSLNIMV